MDLTKTERSALTGFELRSQLIQQQQRDLHAEYAEMCSEIENRLKLPAGAINSTHEFRDFQIVKKPEVKPEGK